MYDANPMNDILPCTTAIAESPIEIALVELGKELSDLEESVSRLHSRVSKVATPPLPPMPVAGGKEEKTVPHSQMWHGIREARQRIAFISADIRELTSRLET